MLKNSKQQSKLQVLSIDRRTFENGEQSCVIIGDEKGRQVGSATLTVKPGLELGLKFENIIKAMLKEPFELLKY